VGSLVQIGVDLHYSYERFITLDALKVELIVELFEALGVSTLKTKTAALSRRKRRLVSDASQSHVPLETITPVTKLVLVGLRSFIEWCVYKLVSHDRP
jgi:hypothetical protein